MTSPCSTAVAAILVVATTAVLWPLGAPAAADDGAGCEDGGGVTVVVDYNEIGGDTRIACVAATGDASAAELFTEAGFPLEYQPQLQDFVCTVTGVPADRSCTAGDSYWSLWWAGPSGEWAYSTLGVTSLEVPAGGSLGFAWHEGDGDAAPPDVVVGGDAPARATDTTAEADGATDGATAGESSDDGDDGGLPTWALIGLAVLVLGTATGVSVLRRRAG